MTTQTASMFGQQSFLSQSVHKIHGKPFSSWLLVQRVQKIHGKPFLFWIFQSVHIVHGKSFLLWIVQTIQIVHWKSFLLWIVQSVQKVHGKSFNGSREGLFQKVWFFQIIFSRSFQIWRIEKIPGISFVYPFSISHCVHIIHRKSLGQSFMIVHNLLQRSNQIRWIL